MSDNIESELGFLIRTPIYETVKPYACRFWPDDFPSNNVEVEKKKVVIHDARQLKPTLEEHGFTLTSYPTKMTYSDFITLDNDKIENIYAIELQEHIKDLFKARHVRVIDYLVRKRHCDFPASTGQQYQNQQPAGLQHLDFAHEEVVRMLRTLYGDRAQEIMRYRWALVNVWRPLKGPLMDWPLAVCDSRTFDINRDGQVSDAVYPDWSYENVLVHHHPDQKWYYYSKLMESETMLFKCTDSDPAASGPCPHGSFPNPESKDPTERRESVESRVLIMWAPIDDFPKEVGEIYRG